MNIEKKYAVIRKLLLATTVLGILSCSSPSGPALPNIVLLMGDDHGWEETGYNGHPYVQTPVLDKMASQGLRFDRFYSASPVCSPTRASVITGRHPNRCGTFTPNWSIRPEEISIAQILRDEGYATAHFGKWHLGPVKNGSPTNPGAMGFDEWLSHDNFFELNPSLSRNGALPEIIQGESSEILIAEAIEFGKKATAEAQPYFMVIWFGSPHEPYSALPKDLALYNNLPDSLSQLTTRLTSMKTGNAVMRSRDSVLQERYAEITAMDRSIGHLRTHLQSEGQRENTLLWYCGDNGVPSSGVLKSPLRGLKGQVYDGGIRVPGIIEWPAMLNGSEASTISCVTSDILPTLVDIVGASLPDRPIDGLSLMPLFKNEWTTRPSPIYFWNYDTRQEMEIEREPYIHPDDQVGTTPLAKIMDGKYTRSFRNFKHPKIEAANYKGGKAVFDDQYKLVITENQDEIKKELFDILSDPGEQNDLSNNHPGLVDSINAKLIKWQESVLNSLTGADY